MISIASPEFHPYERCTTEALSNMTESTIFRSKLPDIHLSNHLPLHTYCFEKLANHTDNSCLIFGPNDKTYSYAETYLLCRRTAVALSSLGIKQGDVILLLLQNCPEFVFAFMGASFLGAAVTTANPLCMPSEIHKQITASGSKLVITHSIYANKIQSGITVITVDQSPGNSHLFSLISDWGETTIPDVLIEADDTVAMPFSSGTTGMAKGVMLTHRNLVTSIAQQVDGENPNIYLTSADVVLCVLPLFHIFSLNSVLLCSLRAGAAVLIMPKFEVGAMLNLIEKYKVTMISVVPPLVLALAKNPMVDSYDLSSIRLALSGAAPLGKELEAALRRLLPQAVIGQVF